MARSLKPVTLYGRWLLVFLVPLAAHLPATAQQAVAPAPLTANEVMARVEAGDAMRAQRLAGYTSFRTYHLESHGLLSKKAEMTVRMEYHSPNKKEFQIVSESGSRGVRNRVFRRLLNAEREAMDSEARQKSAINRENYRFELESYSRTKGDSYYILRVQPKRRSQLLFAGRIWVDADDFVVTRIEGEPAVNPSWWTRKTEFRRKYQRVGQVWLPESNYSVTNVRVFGTAVLTITYCDYRIAESPDATMTSDSILASGNRTTRAPANNSQNDGQIGIHPLELLPLTPAASSRPKQ